MVISLFIFGIITAVYAAIATDSSDSWHYYPDGDIWFYAHAAINEIDNSYQGDEGNYYVKTFGYGKLKNETNHDITLQMWTGLLIGHPNEDCDFSNCDRFPSGKNATGLPRTDVDIPEGQYGYASAYVTHVYDMGSTGQKVRCYTTTKELNKNWQEKAVAETTQ